MLSAFMMLSKIFRFPYENIMISALYDVHKVTSGNPTRGWMGNSKFASGKSLIHSKRGFSKYFLRDCREKFITS